MKIVCDACQAKYSISDDKVQGKVFKIRCKKCSNIIVVRGGASAAEPAPQPPVEKDTRVYDYGYEGGAPAGDEAVWHVVINQDQVGPMTVAEVQQRFSSGEIDAETYVWREGFTDWMPLAQVDAFAGYVASGTQTQTSTLGRGGGGGGAAAVASMFGGSGAGLGGDEAGTVRSDPGDLFATASSSASARRGDDDGDLFGSKPAAAARPTAASEAAAAKLRGERNENSVLFSLNNLAQLASDKPVPVTSAPSSSSSQLGHATGASGGEGSGLIDIRSMANAYLGGAGAAKPSTSSAIGSIDDLPVFGGGGFSEPAVIVPTARSGGNNKLMFALIGSVGLLAVAAVILVIVMMGKDKEKDGDSKIASGEAATATGSDKAAGADKGTPAPEKPPEKPPESGSAATAGAADPKTPDSGGATQVAAKDPAADPKTPGDVKKAPPATAPGISAQRPPATTPKAPVVAATTTPKPKDPPKEPAGGCDEVNCLLSNYEGACCAKFKKGAKPGTPASTPGGAKPAGDLPERLDRTMISDGVAKVKARVMACGDKSPAKGQVKVSVKVSPEGGITSVTVTSTPDPALGTCVASAMQRATFRKTANGGSFGYPFVF